MSVIDQIKQSLEEFKQKRKALTNELQKEFPGLLKPLFEKSAKIESIGWAQYTPYFNDGDECIFRVSNDILYVNGVHLEDSDNEILFLHEEIYNNKTGKWDKNPELDQAESQIVDEIVSVLQSVPKEFYKDLFGDHVQVTIYKDGRIETEEYNHD
jgi:hypothetical protein